MFYILPIVISISFYGAILVLIARWCSVLSLYSCT